MCPMIMSRNASMCFSFVLHVVIVGGPNSFHDSLIWYCSSSGCFRCSDFHVFSTCSQACFVVGHSKNRCVSLHSCLHDGHDRSVFFSQCLACVPIRIAPCISKNLTLIRLGLLDGWVSRVGQSIASPSKKVSHFL